MITLIVTASAAPRCHNMNACLSILDWQGIPRKVEVDVKKCMTLAKGKINPLQGFILLTRDGKVLFDAFDLMSWINENGLRRLA